MKILPFLWETCKKNEIWPHPVLIRAMLPYQQLSSRFSKLLCAEHVLNLKHKTIAKSAAKP